MFRRVCVLVALVGCQSSRPAAPAEPAAPIAEPAPATPAEAAKPAPVEITAVERFDAWLAAFNSGDRDAMAALRDSAFVADFPLPPLDAQLGFAEETGGFTVIETEATSPTKHTVLVKEKASDQYGRAVLEIEPAPPHKIRGFNIHAIPTPAKYAPPRLNEADALAVLTAELDKQTAAGEFSGAVAIAKDGKQIFARAYGLADREKKIANTVETRFRIGSMNKMFTAVATLQLVQAGKLKLEDTVGTHLTAYPNQGVATKVTIHHLLSHTGGTGDFFGPEFEKHRLELRTHADYAKLYGARDLEFEPGSKWRYSNYGFLLLGSIIEKVTGKTYYDAVKASVYKRAKMTGTDSPAEGTPKRGRSIGYMRETKKSPWQDNRDTLPFRGTSAGGGDSTVLDLLRFAQALKGHKLLDAAHTEMLTSPKKDTPADIAYGYGFSFNQHGGIRCIGHGGGAPGMNGELLICDNGYTIAVLANVDPPAAGRIAELVLARLPER
jgi:D-alanyl-D-alanine carboxypeptidase